MTPEMNPVELTFLMHAALDGEASAEHLQELDRALAADPVARAQYEELQRFFDRLGRVPRLHHRRA